MSDGNFMLPGTQGDHTEIDTSGPPELQLPTGPTVYNPNYWIKNPEIKRIRERFNDGLFFHDYNAGLKAFYEKNWDTAKQCFEAILDRFEDGPSRYFLKQIEDNNGTPPRVFYKFAID